MDYRLWTIEQDALQIIVTHYYGPIKSSPQGQEVTSKSLCVKCCLTNTLSSYDERGSRLTGEEEMFGLRIPGLLESF